MTNIFISYAKGDRSRAEPLAKALEDQGWSVWWDRKIPPGKTFSQVIEEAINDAKCVIVLWSNESVKSDWVQNEAAEGARRRILVPALIDEVQIPFEFRRIQAADLTDWKAEIDHPGFTIILGAISGIVGPSPLKVKETEQKRKLEEEKKRIEASHKAEQERKQEEAEAKLKVDEEKRKRKETEEAAERAKKAEMERKAKEALEDRKRKEAERTRETKSQRKIEEERKFEQRLTKEDETTQIETEKTDVKHLDTEKKEDKPIVVVRTRQLRRPILLTSIGWAIGGAIGPIIVGVISWLTTSYLTGWAIMRAIGWAIGGSVTVIALRQIVAGIKSKQVLLATIGWVIGCAFMYVIGLATGTAIGYAIGWAIGWAIGGSVTVIVLRQIVAGIKPKQVLFATIGWAIVGTITYAITYAIGQTIGPIIEGVISGATTSYLTKWAIARTIGYAIGGTIGFGGMFLLLTRAEHSD
jgi:hypothetical protein